MGTWYQQKHEVKFRLENFRNGGRIAKKCQLCLRDQLEYMFIMSASIFCQRTLYDNVICNMSMSIGEISYSWDRLVSVA